MLDLWLELDEIDYKKCVEALLPSLVEHCRGKVNPNRTDLFLGGLGSKAVPAVTALLDEMTTDEKDETVVWLVGAHEERIRSSANRHLAEAFGGELIRIGRLAAVDRPGSRLALLATGVEADYNALLKSPLVADGVNSLSGDNAILKGAAGLVMRMAGVLPADMLESQGISLLNTGAVKEKLTGVIGDALRGAGLAARVVDIRAGKSDGAAASGEQAVPAAFEEQFMRRVSAKAAELS